VTGRVKITLRGLPHVDGDLSFWTETCEDGVMVLVNDFPIVAVDMHYCGLPVGAHTPGEEDEIPDDPCDSSNTPKVIVGTWPDGEQWQRVDQILMSAINAGVKHE
jgi:hypothetical protein